MNQDGLECKLKELGKIISDKMGIDFADRRLPDLRRGIERSAKELGCIDWVSCLHWLLSTPITKDTLKVLAGHLTIGETYFFRDEKLFKAIGQRILPEIIHEAKNTNSVIRIWCAGCSTGEEPYSLAILLRSVLGDLSKWNITILATDINVGSLRRAQEGIYTEWSFRGTPDWCKARYFVKEKDGRYRLVNDIKELVTFSYHNLVEDPFPSLANNTNAMHVILCRNVLMYFNPRARSQVINHFSASLVDRGWLIASPAEAALIEHPKLKKVTVFGTLAHQKVSEQKLHLDHENGSNYASFANLLTQMPLLQEKVVPNPINKPSIACELPYGIAPDIEKSKQAKNRPSITFEEAERLYLLGRYEDILNRVISGDGASFQAQIDDAPTLALLARAFANTGNLDQAEQRCQEALKRDRTNPSYYYLLATIQQELGKPEEAARTLRTALYLDPDFVPAHFALANIEKRSGNTQTSLKHFRNVLKLLDKLDENTPIPESEGMTAGRMREIVRTIVEEI